MSIQFRLSAAVAGLVVMCAATGASSQAFAWGIRECSAKYEAAKAANQLNGQSWREFFKGCRASLASPTTAAAVAAPASTATPPTASPSAAANTAVDRAPAPAVAAAPPAASTSSPAPGATAAAENPASSALASRAERLKQCEAEWKAQWAQLRKSDPKATWDKYWSACDKRLSAGNQ